MSINRAILLGHVGNDPEIRGTQSGDRIASFSLATSERWKDKASGEPKETTEWHRIVCFNQATAGVIEQYVKKGSKVSVEGQIKTRKYTDRDGVERSTTEIVIGRFDGRLGLESAAPGARQSEDGYGETRSRTAGTTSAASRPSNNNGGARPLAQEIDDDIPF